MSKQLEAGTYSIREAAARLGISAAYAYRLAKDGTMPVPVIRVGNLLRVRRADLERFIDDPDNHGGLTDRQRDEVRAYVERSCELQGLPVDIEDPGVLADLAGVLRRGLERQARLGGAAPGAEP